MIVLFYGLKAIGLLRVGAEEEYAGLDISEHGMHAYPSDGLFATTGASRSLAESAEPAVAS